MVAFFQAISLTFFGCGEIEMVAFFQAISLIFFGCGETEMVAFFQAISLTFLIFILIFVDLLCMNVGNGKNEIYMMVFSDVVKLR